MNEPNNRGSRLQEEEQGDDYVFKIEDWLGYENRQETHPFTAKYISKAKTQGQLRDLIELEGLYEKAMGNDQSNASAQRKNIAVGEPGMNLGMGGVTNNPPKQTDIDNTEKAINTSKRSTRDEYKGMAEKILAGEEWRTTSINEQSFRQAQEDMALGGLYPGDLYPGFNENAGRGGKGEGRDAPDAGDADFGDGSPDM